MIVWWLLACGAAPEVPSQGPGHFGAFDELVGAVARDDVAGSRRAARDLLAGAEVADAADAEALGGAVGFVQVADADELDDGLVAVASACAACHAAREVLDPERAPSGRLRAAEAVVFSGPSTRAVAEAALREALGAPRE